ncbi:P-loop containing nucleoside triphosphate hydrolase protein [Dactylonectria macrodidyma]|uniref:P-loop containing nucleoside triphosphate hydrolase protein n=1 Tax=Dactylonectria macrodidyma TaxID=307937 RepID=A0A9P9DAX9_9HYPO|nr:P-loop containing nucleoside triphosphate hydrolase protein [Dactylonectria macrodidyma]
MEALRTIQEKLFGNKSPQRVAIVGLGGVGKTQVALQVAYWAREHVPEWSVFWLPALSSASFEQACQEMVRKLGIQGVDKEDAKEVAGRYLASQAAGKWLLIIDNADDDEMLFGTDGKSSGIRDYLPHTDRGRILLTSRSQRIAVAVAGSEVVEVSRMSEADARGLLEESLINKTLVLDDKGVLEFIHTLTYLPLAITQAAAYLNETKESITEYLRLLRNTEQDMVELLATEFTDDTRYQGTHNAVASTWIVSFEQIRKDAADAAKLLIFTAYVEPKAIPRLMLPSVGSEQRMTRAIGVLCGYSFLSRRDGGEMFDMHSLVHLASRVWVKRQNDTKSARHAALAHLAVVFRNDKWEDREVWRQYIPHVLKALQVGGADGDWGGEECQLGYWAGRCLMLDGRNREAFRLLERVVAFRRRTLSEEHLDRLASQHILARAYRADGRVKEAIKLLEHVVAIQRRTLSEEHPDRLASQHELARAYQADGRAKEATKLLEHVVAIQRRTLSEEHPSRMTSQYVLARAYQADGRVKEAIKLLEHVTAVRSTLSEEHPDRLASQHGLARAYQADGRVKGAIKLLEHVVAVRRRTLLEEHHPDRLASHTISHEHTRPMDG